MRFSNTKTVVDVGLIELDLASNMRNSEQNEMLVGGGIFVDKFLKPTFSPSWQLLADMIG